MLDLTSTIHKSRVAPPPKVSALVRESAEFILSNGGPNDEGRAHPTRKRLDCASLELALEIAKLSGLSREWQPYHFPSTMGTYSEPKYVTEVLVKKVNSLLSSDRYHNDLHALLTRVGARELLSPVIETVDGRSVAVSLIQMQRKFSGSPYEMLQFYLRATGRADIAQTFQRYHTACAPKGIFDDKAIRDELLVKKLDQIRVHYYGGSYAHFIQGTSTSELREPFIDRFLGRETPVSVEHLVGQFQSSPYLLIKEYLKLKEQSQLAAGLQPYHLGRTSIDTFGDWKIIDDLIEKKMDYLLTTKFRGNLHHLTTGLTAEEFSEPVIDNIAGLELSVSLHRLVAKCKGSPIVIAQRYLRRKGMHSMADNLRPEHMAVKSRGSLTKEKVNQLLVKKVDQLLADPLYNGDLVKMLTSVRQRDLLSPLSDTLNGGPIEISMGAVAKEFQSSTFRMLQSYLTLTGKPEIAMGFRVYHLAETTHGAFLDTDVVDEVLRKKIDQLLRDKYNGDLHRLLNSSVAEELLHPFLDDLNGRSVVVSMGKVGHHFSQSPYLILRRYLEISGNSEILEQLRPYHLAKLPNGIANDPSVIDELLQKRVELILYSSQYNGDFNKFLREVRARDLLASFQESFAGASVTVSMAGIGVSFGQSLYGMLSHYAKLTHRDFPYTPECFVGSSETRARRLSGNLERPDFKIARSESEELDLTRFGFKRFNGPEKNAVRLLTMEFAASFLGDVPVRYLGLETELLESLQVANQLMDLAPSGSTIIERDARVFNAIVARKDHGSISDKKLLSRCTINSGDIIEEVRQGRLGTYELVNLDFVGQLSQGKIAAVRSLIEQGALAKRSAVLITLADDPIHRSRAKSQGYNENQGSELLKAISDLFGGRYKLHDYAELPYRGGTSNGRQCDMLSLTLLIERRDLN